MSDRWKHRCRPSLGRLALGFAFLLGARSASAQENEPPAVRPDSAPIRTELVIVADADSFIPEGEIREQVHDSAQRVYREKIKRKDAVLPETAVHIHRITRSEYLAIRRIIEEGIVTPAPPSNTKPVLRRQVRAAEEGKWDLDLNGNYNLSRLTINLKNVRSNQPVEPIVIDPAKPGPNPRAELRKTSVGTFEVKLKEAESGIEVVSFSVVRSDFDDKDLPEETVLVEGEDAYWVINIEGFDFSDRKPLFEDLSSRSCANPVRGLREMPLRQYALGSMKIVEPPGSIIFVGSNVVFQINMLGERETKSAYMLFPLGEEEARSLARKLNGQTAYSLPRNELRDRSSATDQEVRLEPAMKPRWFEIPRAAEGNGFVRSFPIGRVGDWKKLPEDKQRVWRLLVWVGKEDDKEVVNRVPDPSFRPLVANQTPPQILVVAEEVVDWPLGIQSRSGEPDKNQR